MAIHITSFGNYFNGLQKFADLNGYVPEEGDSPDDLSWPHDNFTNDFDSQGNGYEGYAESRWDEFVSEAVEATSKASDAINEWRNA